MNANGISGMLALATDNGWKAPWMPGQWHVENVVKDPEVAKVAEAGRAFGVELASRLDRVSAELHRPAPAEFFHDRSVEMCGLAEWVNKSDGIGNLLLTGKCLDLASVGLGRLVADIPFPLKSCQTLAEKVREDGDLIDVSRRAEILDLEYGTTFFRKCLSDDDLQWAWVAGARRDGLEQKSQKKTVWVEGLTGQVFGMPGANW